MRLQVELQQLEENFGIEQRNRQAEGAVENLPSLRSARTPRLRSGQAYEGARPHMGIGTSISAAPCIIQFQLQPQLLDRQSARAQPRADLFQ